MEIGEGEFVGLVRPNGSGKTALLRGLHRSLKPVEGVVLVQSDGLWHLSTIAAARRIAVVLPGNQIGFDFSASKVATMGRLPYKTGCERDTDEDRQLVAKSLDGLGLAPILLLGEPAIFSYRPNLFHRNLAPFYG